MKNLYSRIFLVLLFVSLFCVIHGEEENDNGDKAKASQEQLLKWQLCLNDDLVNKTISIAYLSKKYVNKFVWKIENNSHLHQNDSFVHDLLAVCLCRFNFDPLFFITPYVESDGDDMLAVCVIGNEQEEFTSLDVYDDEELYDLLILKHRELILPSVIDPLTHSSHIEHSKCHDLDGYPAKDIMGQQTCIFSAFSDDYSTSLYSGPLMSLPLLKLDEKYFAKCQTTVNGTNHTTMYTDLCFAQHTATSSKLICCCQSNPESCSLPEKKENHYYCYAGSGDLPSVGDYDKSRPINIIDFYKPFCTLTISIQYETSPAMDDMDGVGDMDDIDDMDDNLGIRTLIGYGASDSCDNNDTITMQDAEKFCSANDGKTLLEKFSKTRCCNGPNLCNFDLLPPELKGKTAKTRTPLFQRPALYRFLNLSCDSYYNLQDLQKSAKLFPGEKYNLYDAFNADILEETQQSFKSLTYIIAKIIKADYDECHTRIIKEEHVNLYFPYFNCGSKNCTVDHQKDLRTFECQQSAEGDPAQRSDTWFCYVKIIPKRFKAFDIEAGFIEIKKFSECYYRNMSTNDYCCINLFDQEQRDSNCTKEKMRETYLKYINSQEAVNNDLPDSLKSYTQCIQKDIGAEQRCPGNDGCFEVLNLSKDDKSEVIKPAGCLGLAEDYTVANSPLTSLSLGCRAGENANRCSVIQAPDGQQKIVCCCNLIEGKNDFCSTKSHHLPKKVGKSISSFKN